MRTVLLISVALLLVACGNTGRGCKPAFYGELDQLITYDGATADRLINDRPERYCDR